MVEDDFDKDLENDEFADEFDFVDEEHAGAPQPKNTPEQPQGKMPGSGFNKNYLIVGSAIVVVLAGIIFAFSGTEEPGITPPQANATPPLPQDPNQIAVNTADQPVAPDMLGQQTNVDGNTVPLPKPIAGNGNVSPDNNVDFNQTFDRAAAAQDQLANALPQSKTFEQVQRELKAGNAQRMALPDEINATLDSISEEMTLNVNQIKHLETTITNLAATVEQLNKSISAMDNRVLGLTETVDGLAQDLSNVKKIIADEDIDLAGTNSVRFSGTKKQSISNSSQEYTVHAIIPGRAWLKNSAGQIITVTEGDKLGDFGSVATIDAANGVVRTSSGITFR